MTNNSDAGVDLVFYKDQNGLPRYHCDTDPTAPNVEILAVRTISVYSIKACPQHTTLLFSQTHQI